MNISTQAPNPEMMRKALYGSLNDIWMHDVPFIVVPPELVAGMVSKGHARFTPMEFYSSETWKEPNSWNAGYIYGGKMVIFMYGHFHTLEKYLYVERIAADPSFQCYGNRTWELMIKEAQRLTKEKGFDYLWTTGFRKGEIRKFLACGGGKLNTTRYILDTKLNYGG